MPLLIDTETRAGTLVAAVNHILVTHGTTGLTMRRISDVSRVSTSSIFHQLGSREHLLRVAAGQTAAARLRDICDRSRCEGPLAFLPSTSDEVLDARAWLAWQELWRSEDFLHTWVGQGRADERGLLARVLDFQLAREALDTTVAVIDGLVVALCAPQRPMSVEHARELLSRHLLLLGVAPASAADVTPVTPQVSSW